MKGSPTKGWRSQSPKRGKERSKMKKKCGSICFLRPKTNGYPICTSSCKISCKGLAAAKIRSTQYKLISIQKYAEHLGRLNNCKWSKKNVRKSVKKSRAPRKSTRTPRKSIKKSRAPVKSTRKPRKSIKKSRAPRKSTRTPRKSVKKSRASRKSARKSRKSVKKSRGPLKSTKKSRKSVGAIPTDMKLYNSVKRKADIVYKKPSAYKSGYIVKEYKRQGGKYKDGGGTKSLKRWYKEKWVDIGGKNYPVYRPTKRISLKTPLTVSEIDIKNLKKQIALKQKIKGKKNLPAFKKKS
jgi:hypothetical protein